MVSLNVNMTQYNYLVNIWGWLRWYWYNKSGVRSTVNLIEYTRYTTWDTFDTRFICLLSLIPQWQMVIMFFPALHGRKHSILTPTSGWKIICSAYFHPTAHLVWKHLCKCSWKLCAALKKPVCCYDLHFFVWSCQFSLKAKLSLNHSNLTSTLISLI